MKESVPHWLDDLTRLTMALGSPAFGDRLLAFLNQVVPVDHCAVFTFDPDGRAGHLFTKSRMPESQAESLAADYVGGYFAADPNYPAVEAVRHDPTADVIALDRGERYDPAYRSHFFEQHDLIDKAATVAKSGQGTVYCNFYRMGGSGRFSAADWARLQTILPLVTSLIASHFRLRAAEQAQPAAAPRQSAQSLVHSVISRGLAPFDRLTPREQDVCARIVLGYSSTAIGLDLAIAPSSVATYRRRAYGKLGIATQNELFALCLNAIEGVNAPPP